MEKEVSFKESEKDNPFKEMQKEVPFKQMEKDVPSEQTVTSPVEPTPVPQAEKSSSGSAISSLIGGRNCIITTTIVTELTHVEPYNPDIQNNGQVRL